MANVQKYFLNYHDEIKLKRFSENKKLRDKRDIITKQIKTGLQEYFTDKYDSKPTIEFINQGSYALDLGIKPSDGDYDIDVGVVVDCYKENHDDPVELKVHIEDMFDGKYTVPPKIKNPCVTITYTENGKSSYHVDLPIYVKSDSDSELYLAKGYRHSDDENKEWEHSDPVGLTEHIKNRFSGDEKLQFKRVVRYLKKWKSIKFNSDGNNEPPSVGITLMACDMFTEVEIFNSIKGKNEYSDLKAMKNLVNEMIYNFENEYHYEREEYMKTIEQLLPVAPEDCDIFGKMSLIQKNSFYNKLVDLTNVLEYAENEIDPYLACTELRKMFGDKFEIPEKKDTRYTADKSSAPSSGSANG